MLVLLEKYKNIKLNDRRNIGAKTLKWKKISTEWIKYYIYVDKYST